MLEKDEDFYRKWVAILAQTSVRPLSMKSQGSTLTFFHGNKKIAEMNAVLFYKLSIKEIFGIIGVPRNDK
jgi:hypothetical protein